jgi:hypothetical protein
VVVNSKLPPPIGQVIVLVTGVPAAEGLAAKTRTAAAAVNRIRILKLQRRGTAVF